MAVHREPEYCRHCGKQLIEKHRKVKDFVGDTFIGYKQCECWKLATPPPQPLGIDALAKALAWTISSIEYLNKDDQDISISEQLPFAKEALAGYAASTQSNSGIDVEEMADNYGNGLFIDTGNASFRKRIRIAGRDGFKAGHAAILKAESSTSEEEKEVKQEFRKLARQMILSGFTETFLQEIFSKYKISKR